MSSKPKQRTLPPSAEEPPTVSPRWLLAAFALTLLLAAFCGYAALCLLFYQGQWQLLFHPTRSAAAQPAVPFDNFRFDVDEAGHPRLNGWYIPADSGSRYGTDTVLYLHDARGSLSDCVPALTTLHSLGINVFAFDYRGFGLSEDTHPGERLATEDSIAAWTYLTDTRHNPPSHLIVFGDGVGAVFAARIAAQFAPAGVILEDPSLSARQIFSTDARARILPLWLLQNQKLDPAPDLAVAHVPRLFLEVAGKPIVGPMGSESTRTRSLFEASSYPKLYVDLRTLSVSGPDSAFAKMLRRFFDDTLAPSP
jgi:pimeloyl-ACP methyl ester carboxylesterase